jgi:short-subunit dehydrogenase
VKLPNAGALVTGASSGIGAALSSALAGRGARVVRAARSGDLLERLAAEVGGTALVADLGAPAEVEGLIERAEAASAGPIDVVVHNASTCAIGAFATRDPSTIGDVLQVDLTAVMQLTRALPAGTDDR